MATAIATDKKEAAIEQLQSIHSSLDTLKNGITFFTESLSESAETKPISDDAFKEDLKANLNDALERLGKQHRDATRKSIKEFGNTLTDAKGKGLIQTVWTKFLEFEADTVPDLEKKLETKLGGLKTGKLAPFHLMELFPLIQKVQEEVQSMIDVVRAIE